MIQTRQCRVYLVMTPVAVEFSGDAAGNDHRPKAPPQKLFRASRGEIKGVGQKRPVDEWWQLSLLAAAQQL